jgi:hypothetical protein
MLIKFTDIDMSHEPKAKNNDKLKADSHKTSFLQQRDTLEEGRPEMEFNL